MAKILLLSPPYLDLYGRLSKAAGRYFPLGLGYIASYLRRYGGHEVRMYEPEAQNLSSADLAAIIKAAVPDVIGLTCSTPNFTRALELAKIGRQYSDARIVLGGVHASALPEFITEHYSAIIDYVVVGEGEATMLELANALASNAGADNLPGLVFKRGGNIVNTGCRPFIEDLDSIPFPARDLIPQGLFMPNLHNARYKKCLSILTSRGCPFNCSFCASRIVSGKKYRMHSAEYVLEEMEMLKKDYHARQLIITDDTFTINRDRLAAICEGMIERRLDLAWFCFSQVGVADRSMLALMKRAGCYSIGFGVESAEESVLAWMGKPIKPARALEAVRAANEVGMKTQAFYIFGSPGETRKQMEHTVQFAQEVNSTLAFFNMLVPYPGTREFTHFFAGVPLKDIEWRSFVAVGERCVLKNSTVPPNDIERLIANANIRYYARPKRLLGLLRHIGTFYEFCNYIKGGIGLIRQVAKWCTRRTGSNDNNTV